MTSHSAFRRIWLEAVCMRVRVCVRVCRTQKDKKMIRSPTGSINSLFSLMDFHLLH